MNKNKKTVCLLLASAFLLIGSPSLAAKKEHKTCAFEIESQAQRKQACLVKQETEKQCDASLEAFQATIKRCTKQGMPAELVKLSVEIGEGKVNGDPKDSPWQRLLAIKKAANEMLAENRYRYESTFQGQIDPPANLNQNFNLDACPLAFKVNGGKRWAFWKKLVVYENAELDLPFVDEESLPTTHLWFLSMKPSECYRPGQTELFDNPVFADREELIYNLPEEWFSTIKDSYPPVLKTEQRGTESKSAFRLSKPLEVTVKDWEGPMRGIVSVHRCHNASFCDNDYAQFEKHYTTYRAALQSKVRANTCLDYLKPNASGEININALFEFDCSEENAKKIISDSDKTLDRMREILVAKPTP